ncbi:MAG: branched-chain amino acid ABC transporter permease [Propionibacteriaceae bacterium]|jgi:branched-chain amino acid transport system permease protein|nr:branched-chain amino acid ABC transporter permease [Propionibacteriaceae bacterium]
MARRHITPPDLLIPPGDLPPAPKRSFRWASERGAVRCIGLAVVAIVLALPFFNNSAYLMTILASAMIYVMMAMGLNVVVGHAGLLDLGYIAFYAVGAYTSGILTTRLGLSQVQALPFVVLVCLLAGVIIGGPTLRLRSDYLAIVTLGFGEIIRITANNLSITGGPSGIYAIPGWEFFGWRLRDGFTVAGLRFDGMTTFYYFTAAVVIVFGVLGVSQIGRGKMGRAWKAVRDDEDAAEAMGINTYKAKITAYMIGAVWAGLAGQLMATQNAAISPNSFQFLNSALILMAVVLGGMGSMPGVVIGALFISLAPEFLRQWAEWRFLIFGLLLILVMLFRPQGVWPSTKVLPWSRGGPRRRRPPDGPPTPGGAISPAPADGAADGAKTAEAAP